MSDTMTMFSHPLRLIAILFAILLLSSGCSAKLGVLVKTGKDKGAPPAEVPLPAPIPSDTAIDPASGGPVTPDIVKPNSPGPQSPSPGPESPAPTPDPTGPMPPTAVLTGAPSGTYLSSNLFVIVGGTGVVDYQFALLSGAADCSGASYGAWTPVATAITTAVGANGPKLLCVLGRDNGQLVQAAPTSAAFTKASLGTPDNARTVSGDNIVTVNWTTAGAADGYLVIRRETAAVTFTPVNGTNYSVSDAPAPDHIVVAKGSAQFFVDTTAVNGTTYHYAVFSYSSDTQYNGGLAPGTVASGSPMAVPPTFIRLGNGSHASCGVGGDGAAYCWGDDANNQTGNGATTTPVDIPTPVDVSALPLTTAFVDVQVGNQAGCGLTSDGIIYCWGNDSNWGVLGNGGLLTDSAPTPVALDLTAMPDGPATRWRALSVGKYSVCAITTKGAPACWGRGQNGSLGTGNENNAGLPTPLDLTNVPGSKQFKDITQATANACGTTVEGITYCWGTDFNDLLGDGAASPEVCEAPQNCSTRPVPVVTSAFASSEKPVAAATGERHSCLMTSAGKVFCWADDDSGNQGDGLPISTQNVSPNPITLATVPGVQTARSIDSGRNQTCFVTDAGQPYCFGNGQYGKIGNDFDLATDNFNASPTPMYLDDILTERSVRTVSTGLDHGCMTTGPGWTYCFGRDNLGQLGITAATANQGRPAPITTTNIVDASRFVSIAAMDEAACGIDTRGRLWCWGSDSLGQLGNGGTDTDVNVPSQVSLTSIPGDKSFMKISGGKEHACGLTYAGEIHCFGSDNIGQLGDGAAVRNTCSAVACGSEPAPVDDTSIPATTRFKDVAAGAAHTCALTGAGHPYCWGDDGAGQLGLDDGAGGNKSVPTAVNLTGTGPLTFIQIAAGASHTCALTSEGLAYCWGDDRFGQLGDGDVSNTSQEKPALVNHTGVTGRFVSIASRDNNTCGVTGNGNVYCWGLDASGQIGDGAGSATCSALACRPGPTLVSGGLVNHLVAVGNAHACAVGGDGTVNCWGAQDNGRLGNGSTASAIQNTPVAVVTAGIASNVKSFKIIAAGKAFTCGIAGDGLGYCWGAGTMGQLGNTANVDQGSPVLIALP